MKHKITFNNYLIKYNKYINKLNRLQLTGRNLRRQNILKKHIARLEQKLSVLLLQLKPTRVATTLAVAGILAINNNAQAQSFDTETINPFSLAYIGERSAPVFVDLDDDGDLDVLSGEYYGSFYYFENITTSTDTETVFDTASINPFGLLTNFTNLPDPTFVDLDGDGDLDLLSGDYFGEFNYFENTGSNAVAEFGTSIKNPFGLTDIGYYSAPTFADLDGDGDLDLLSGSLEGFFYYFENITTSTDTETVFDTVTINPFGLTDIGNDSTPAFADLDGDGDLDLLSGTRNGDFYYFENITASTDTETVFDTAIVTPFNLKDVGSNSVPTLVDLDGDGDLDLLSGEDDGDFYYFENTTTNNGSLSTDDVIANEVELAVYPNPSSSIVNISVSKQFTINAVSVLNILGKEVLTTVHNSNKATLQVEDLAIGIYTVNIKTNKGAITQKLIIE